MELRLLLAAIRRGAVILVLALAVGIALGFAAYRELPRHYTASSTLLIDSGAILIPGQQPYTGDPERYISDQQSILGGQAIADQVATDDPDDASDSDDATDPIPTPIDEYVEPDPEPEPADA